MKRQVARISILQSSKIVTALSVLLGLLSASFRLPTILDSNEPLYDFGLNFVFLPVQLAVAGFIGFVVFAALYNVLAPVFGGIEYEVTELTEY